MSTRKAKWLAWSLVTFAIALGLGTLPLLIAVARAASAPNTPLPPQLASSLGLLGPLGYLVTACGFGALGAVIVSRDRAHAIGWLFCAIGVEGSVEFFTDAYAIYTLFVAPGTLPGGQVAGWIQNWVWVVGIMLFAAFVPLFFPTGRLLSARWRPAWWLALGVTTAGVLLVAFQPGPLANILAGAAVPNPFGVASLGAIIPVLISAEVVVAMASILLAVASLVVRLRQAQGVERQQIKWFAYFAMLFALLFVAQTVVQNVLGISSPLFDAAWGLGIGLTLLGLPIATAFSILRYRLFDIDVLIRRTLVYGTLTALLGTLYAGLIIGLQAVVSRLTGQTGESPLVIVVSTLAIAALVLPLRRRIQSVIDRRFYRRKYDAEKTLAAFSAALRQEVDLKQVQERLVAVVQETMQPAHISLWLRPSERRSWQSSASGMNATGPHSRHAGSEPTPPRIGPLSHSQ